VCARPVARLSTGILSGRRWESDRSMAACKMVGYRKRNVNFGQQSLIRGAGRMTLLRLGLPLFSWRALATGSVRGLRVLSRSSPSTPSGAARHFQHRQSIAGEDHDFGALQVFDGTVSIAGRSASGDLRRRRSRGCSPDYKPVARRSASLIRSCQPGPSS
jgi:hypothetical protein